MAKVNYDPNVDYQALINQAVASGNTQLAGQYEAQRNAKIADLNASGTNKWNAQASYNYTQPTSYAQATQQQKYTPGYTGTYYEDIFADPTNPYNARVWVPGSGWTAVEVGTGIQGDESLVKDFPGSLLETSEGIFEITGLNPAGGYVTKPYTGKVPSTPKDYSVFGNMYDMGYNSASIGQMLQDHQNGVYGQNAPNKSYAEALKNQTATYIDENGEKQTGVVQNNGSYYDSLLNTLNQQYQSQIAANDAASAAATQQAILQLENQRRQLDDDYTGLYEQLYLNRRMNEKNLPQQLAAMGYTGGLTESSLLQLQNEYQNNLRQGRVEQMRGDTELQMAIAQAQLTGDLERAQQAQQLASQYYGNYADVIMAMQQQANLEREYQMQQSQQQNAQLADNGWVLLENGIMPSAYMLAAMGMNEREAQALLDSMGGGSQNYVQPTNTPLVDGVADKWVLEAINQGSNAGHWLSLAVQTGNMTPVQAQKVAQYIDAM